MSSIIFQEAAKRFQQRAAITTPVESIRTAWGRSDVDTLAPLLSQSHHQQQQLQKQQQDQSVIAEIKSCEGVFIVWKTFIGFFSFFDVVSNSSNASTDPCRVAQRFLQLHAEAYYDADFLAASASEFARVASRGTPNQREFQVAYQAAICFALSGRVTEASLILESMIQGVNAVVESRNLRANGNSSHRTDDDDDGPDGPFSPEEQCVFEAVANLLRVPFTESRESLGRWRSAASKLLGDIRSVAVAAPGRIPELDILRRFALQVLFIISGDTKVLKETVNSCDFLEGKALWYAAGLCSLMSPLASKKQIVDAINEYATVAQSATSFSPVRVTTGAAAAAGIDAPPSEWDLLVINAISADRAPRLVSAVQRAVNFATSRASGNAKASTLAALMGAHLADLCCDLRDPDDLVERNNLVENYVRMLFVNFPGLWEIAFSYVTASPLMDPQAVALCLRQGSDAGDLELALRLYDEVVQPRCAHQQQLRARWRRTNPNIDWPAIFETVDFVVEGERRAFALERAAALWDEESRYVDAVNLLVSSGNYTAAEHRIRSALENFASRRRQRLQPVGRGGDDDAVADDDQNNNIGGEDFANGNQQSSLYSSSSSFDDPVIAIGDAASMGQVSDPTLEGKLQRKAAANLMLASPTTLNIGAPTPLALCRRVAELYAARNAINTLDFILPIVADQNFVVSTPSPIKKFVLSLAVANLGHATMEQLLVLNCVIQQCAQEFGGEKGLNEESKRILELLVR